MVENHPLGLNLQVESAVEADIPSWLELASELGDLFGADMAHDPEFLATLSRNIARGSAFCVRIDAEFAGAMLFRKGQINWLGVGKRFRRRGVGRALVAYAQAIGGQAVRVTTFGEGHPHPDAVAAQRMYRRLGFERLEEQLVTVQDGTPRMVMIWRTEK